MSLYFFAKLIPPRPSFAFDMSDAEKSLMQEHGAYWTQLASSRQAVVFGPVADPAGPFGLVVLEVDTELEAQRLTANDPVIRSGLNFRFEAYPMLSAVSRT